MHSRNENDKDMNKSGEGPLVSVIIVARDEEENLDRCLAGVLAQQVDFNFEVLVLDSGSKDRTVEVARSYGARVMEIPAGSFQHGRTRQSASEEARGEYLVYIVADATPADEHWLSALVEPLVSDERVAGAFSRQLPREGADVLESLKTEHRVSSGVERKERKISPELDFWSLSPEERLEFCEFDDVSCCRRRSVLEEHPIPSVDWAEDLIWSLDVLLAGYKIVYEPASAVRHSHRDTLSHAFRRGFLDQGVVLDRFGVLYFDSVVSWARGFLYLYFEKTRPVFKRSPSAAGAFVTSAWNFFRLLCETGGNFLASGKPRRRHAAVSLGPLLVKKNRLKRRYKGQVLLTRFSLGPDTRRVVFMNPDAASVINVRVPEGGRLEFGAGINPAARPLRDEPVLFMVAVDGEPVWWKEIDMGERNRCPCWEEGAVSLKKWSNKKVRLAFITRSSNTDYAWAGWSEPLITTERLSALDRAVNWFLDFANKRVKGVPLRHP
ncbi:MAG: glycosyltransferase family 2 protein [bacterium]